VHILLAYDGSEPADEAVALAVDRFDVDRLTALYVYDPSDDDTDDDPEARAAEVLAAVGDRVPDGVEVTTTHAVGDPADEIVAGAEATGADHVVLGSHGREGMSRLLLGSVAETVVRGSPVPVTVVR
jgi:nucleotide-binding universal stress UspA family protein